jgi:nitric oxide dioxygenase
MSLKVELLAESFDVVLSQRETFAKTFYSHLFSVYPQTRLLFKETNMKQQEAALVAALGLVISSLKKSDYDQLAAVLQRLGQRHEGYGVTREQYWMVGNVLLRTFADFLGSRWTAELNDAWADAYQAVVGLMQPVREPTEA